MLSVVAFVRYFTDETGQLICRHQADGDCIPPCERRENKSDDATRHDAVYAFPIQSLLFIHSNTLTSLSFVD